MQEYDYYEKVIEGGESENVEFKSSYDKEGILRSVGAFSNKDGGIILIGVTDDGRIRGYKHAEAPKKIADDINSAIYPSVNITIKERIVKQKNIVIIEVPPAPIKPVSVRGRFYIRTGSTNRLMNVSEICDLYSLSTSRSWDSQVLEFAKFDDIDMNKVNRFINLLEERRNIEVGISPLEFLRRKLFVKDEKVTNAAILLFGKDPQKFFPTRVVQIVFHRANKARPWFQEEITGTIFEMIENSYNEVLKLLSTKLEIIETRNLQKFAVPPEALREGIINALVHRDWAIPSPVYIEISRKNLIISNPGIIPPPLAPEALKEGQHFSILRNPKLGEALYEAGYIERYGSGTLKINEAYSKSQVKPEWNTRMGRTFLYIPYMEEDLEMAILKLVKRVGKVKTSDVVSELGISMNTARKYLKILTQKGLLREIGKTKGRYFIVNPDSN